MLLIRSSFVAAKTSDSGMIERRFRFWEVCCLSGWSWLIVSAAALAVLAFLLIMGLAIRAFVQRLISRRIASWQNDLVAKHCEEVQNIYREMRGWRHDFHNHIQTMKAYRKLGEDAKLDEYLTALDADLSEVDTLIKSGNVKVDAILNSKLSLAKERQINVSAKATVPSELSVSEIDLCVILGNLLDNAIEAALRIENEADRLIRVYIDIKRDQLYISVTNTCGGKVIKQNGTYLSVKRSNSHGFGLMRVDRLVDKYEGYIKRRDEEGAFTTEVMLPV
jgi:two-component system sensor histidine kinase AgrC